MSTSVLIPLVVSLLMGLLSTVRAAPTLANNNCLADVAFFNVQTKMCECKPGFEGQGDICCTPVDSKDVCLITGDPYMTSVPGQTIPLNIPCSVCVNVMQGTTAAGEPCVFEILSSSIIGAHGTMYTERVRFGVSINRKSATYYTFTDAGVLGQSGNLLDIAPDTEVTYTVSGEEVKFYHESTSGLWTAEGCGNRVVFRPMAEANMGKPGVCMEAKKGSTVMTPEMGNLCNLRKGPINGTVPMQYDVLDNALNVRLKLNALQTASNPDYDDVCGEQIDYLIKDMCQGFSKEGMKKCGPILYNSVIRSCLSAAGVKGPAIAELFALCLEIYCTLDVDKCNQFKANKAMQTCVPSMTDCQNWE